jgi:hypothetical protein
MASAFALIIPNSDIEVGRFRLMGATLPQMPGWCNDLSYACALSSPVANLWRPSYASVANLQKLLAGRESWLVCNFPADDEGDLFATHSSLRAEFPHLLTVYVPLDATRAGRICRAFHDPATGSRAVCASSSPPSCMSFCLSVTGCLTCAGGMVCCRWADANFNAVHRFGIHEYIERVHCYPHRRGTWCAGKAHIFSDPRVWGVLLGLQHRSCARYSAKRLAWALHEAAHWIQFSHNRCFCELWYGLVFVFCD